MFVESGRPPTTIVVFEKPERLTFHMLLEYWPYVFLSQYCVCQTDGQMTAKTVLALALCSHETAADSKVVIVMEAWCCDCDLCFYTYCL